VVDEPWRLTRGTDDWWAGTARRWPWGKGTALPPDEFSFFVESTTGTTVEKVSLEAEVYDPDRRGPAMKAEFARLVPILFDRLGLAVPAGLSDAIAGERSFTETTPYGVVRFERRNHKPNAGHDLVLTIEAPK
jgi:hypothetical protein